MKSKKDLESMVLRHMLSYPEAVDKAKAMGIAPEHFNYVEPMQKMCYPRQIFRMVVDYFEDSGGSLVTYNVFSNKLQKSQIDDSHKSELELLWQNIQDFDYDVNDLHDLLVQLKNNLALEYFGQMYKKGFETMSSDGVEDAVELIAEKIEQVRAELRLMDIEQESVDMTNGAKQFEEEYKKRKNDMGQYRGIKFGLRQIDEKTLGVFPGSITVLLAPSSGGKSIQLLNIADYVHRVEKKNVLYFSFEMDEWLCQLRHVSLITKIPFNVLKSITCDDDQMASIVNKLTEIEGGPYFRYEVSMEDPTPEFIETKIREITKAKGKPDLVIVDYIGNMTTRNASRNAKPWERQGDVFERLFAMAKRLKFHCLTAQQVNRETIRENRKKKEEGKGGAYYQDASSGDQRLMHLAYYVFGLEPDRELNIMTYHPVKMRDCLFEPFSTQVDPSNNNIYEISEDRQAELKKIRSSSNTEVKEIKKTSTENGETRVDWGNGTNITDADDFEVPSADDWLIGGNE